MSKYFRRGKTRVYYLPSMASMSGPTSGELAAGTEITAAVGAATGFTFQNNPINVPDLSSTFTSQIPGEDTAPASQFTFYDDDSGTSAAHTLLQKGTTGFIVFAIYGTVSGKRCAAFPIIVSAAPDEFTVANDPARFMTSFTITSPPNLNAVLP